MGNYYQQGDVLLFPVSSIPASASKQEQAILARGEVTGHFHEAIGLGVEAFASSDSLYVSAPEGATVVHQEHGPITLPPGTYERRLVRIYDHLAEEARSVED